MDDLTRAIERVEVSLNGALYISRTSVLNHVDDLLTLITAARSAQAMREADWEAIATDLARVLTMSYAFGFTSHNIAQITQAFVPFNKAKALKEQS